MRFSVTDVRPRRVGQRGAVLVEFALSALIIFTTLFGTLQLGLVGIEQIKADGAAFTGAHQDALYSGSGVSPTTLVRQTYPGLTAGQIAFAPNPLPSSGAWGNGYKAEPVDYGLSQPNAQSSRHGGFSIIVPTQLVATVLRPIADNLVLGVTGSAFNLSGIAAEPQFEELGVHGDVDGNALNSSGMFANRVDYFSQGENTPPYFVGFRYANDCFNLAVYPCSSITFDAFGLAEYLDVDNWSRSKNGVTTGAVFQAMLTHQQTFAKIADDLAALTGGAQGTGTLAAMQSSKALANYLNPAVNSTLHCMYTQWDNHSSGGYALAGSQIGDFPLHPDVVCP